jgi:hypothetical protein
MRDIQIVIRAQSIFYAIAAVLVMYAIDKKLLMLPVFSFVLAIMIVPAFAASSDIERVLDLSAFSIDWCNKREETRRLGLYYACPSERDAPFSDYARSTATPWHSNLSAR